MRMGKNADGETRARRIGMRGLGPKSPEEEVGPPDVPATVRQEEA